ncbi:MAG: hypothetical protein IM638_09360 [Bacteroidetes bacterium]|nr:hypothetical protein [Bacteroidota bacterium]
MEGMVGMGDDWGFILLVFLIGILPVILGIVQLLLSVVYVLRRKRSGKGISGWLIYWASVAVFLAYYFVAPKHGMAQIPDYFLLCYVPALWFFVAGRFSDKMKKTNASLQT